LDKKEKDSYDQKHEYNSDNDKIYESLNENEQNGNND